MFPPQKRLIVLVSRFAGVAINLLKQTNRVLFIRCMEDVKKLVSFRCRK